MPPVEIVFILALLAFAGNIAAMLRGISFPSLYYAWVAFGCLVVACFYFFLIFQPSASLETRALVARWGYIILFVPMCYPLIFILARKYLWKMQ